MWLWKLLIFLFVCNYVSCKTRQINTELYIHDFYNEFMRYDQENFKTDHLQELVQCTIDKSKISLSDVPEARNVCILVGVFFFRLQFLIN